MNKNEENIINKICNGKKRRLFHGLYLNTNEKRRNEIKKYKIIIK